jgi:hypothetical protein
MSHDGRLAVRFCTSVQPPLPEQPIALAFKRANPRVDACATS